MSSSFSVIATDRGILPFGGTVDETPIYRAHNSFLELEQQATIESCDMSWRTKIAFTLDDVLSPEECSTLIKLTESMGFNPAAPGIQTPPGMRQNQTVHWIANEADTAEIYRRIHSYLPQNIDGMTLDRRISQRFNTYRYIDGEVFKPHVDGDWPGYGISESGELETWQDSRSMLSMLLYLNGEKEGVQGGDTILFDERCERHRITPKAGRALFFRHGIHEKSVVHAGDRVIGEVPKYVVRINIMYCPYRLV